MSTRFGDHLYALIKAAGLNVTSFAKLVDQKQPNISAIKAGREPPPMKHMEQWATALGLKGDARQRFIEIAAVANMPDEVQPHFYRLIDNYRDLLKRVERLEGRRGGGGDG